VDDAANADARSLAEDFFLLFVGPGDCVPPSWEASFERRADLFDILTLQGREAYARMAWIRREEQKAGGLVSPSSWNSCNLLCVSQLIALEKKTKGGTHPGRGSTEVLSSSIAGMVPDSSPSASSTP
jgi:hypothetical protein